MEPGEEYSSDFLAQDKTFDLNDCSLYQLLFHWDGGILKYLIMDPGTDVVLLLGKSYIKNEETADQFLNRVYKDHDFLKKEYKSVLLTESGNPTCLVPQSLFDTEKAEDLMRFANGNVTNQINQYKHSKLGAIMISENSGQENWFMSKYPNLKYYPNASLMIETLIRKDQFDKKNALYIEVGKTRFEIFALVRGQFQLFNSFEANHENDFVYFTLNVIQQLELEPEQTHIYLSGNIGKAHPYYKLLLDYFDHVHFNTGLANQDYALGITTDSKPEFTSLYNLYSCVS